MADISKLKISNTTYNIKDEAARTSMSNTSATATYSDDSSAGYPVNYKIGTVKINNVSTDFYTRAIVKQFITDESNYDFPLLMTHYDMSNDAEDASFTRRCHQIYANPYQGSIAAMSYRIIGSEPTGTSYSSFKNILTTETLTAHKTQTFPATTGTVLNTGTTSYTQTVASTAQGAYKVGSIKINNNTTDVYGQNDKVYQKNFIGNHYMSILMSNYEIGQDTQACEVVGKTSKVGLNPYTGRILANTFEINQESYNLLTAEPSDWSTNYTSYYTKSGSTYSSVSGSSAPTFTANTYYAKNSYKQQLAPTADTLTADTWSRIPTTNGVLLNTGNTSFTRTITPNDTNVYKIGTITINSISTDIYGRDTKEVEHYGFKINKNDSNPSTRVEYMYDAVGMVPAGIKWGDGEFNYGSWRDAWFVANNRPCALKYDGTVDYYLDPDNYLCKIDGTLSDVESSAYDGNFMASMPTVWIRRWEDYNYYYVDICNKQLSSEYKAYAHDAGDGYINDFIYFPMFKGVVINDKLRSIKGHMPTTGQGASAALTAARANGTEWHYWTFSGRALINDLLTLMSKSTNSQAAFGTGISFVDGDDYAGRKITGETYGFGQFYGYDNTKHMKVFHIEDYWGNGTEWCLGLHLIDGKYKYKLTPPYNSGGNNTYITSTMTSPSAGHVKDCYIGDFGFLPKTNGASASTYWCDYYNATLTGTTYGFCSGFYGTKESLGYMAMGTSLSSGYTSNVLGASVIYLPPHSS